MDLDHRAADAAAQLRDEVDAEVDLDAAYGRVLAGVGRQRTRATGLRLGVAALVGLVAVGALAVVITAGAGPSDDGRQRNAVRTPLPEELTLDDGITPQGAAILGGLPDGPLDGKESQRLPVVADRADDLQEGDQVTLYGKGFTPGELVGAVHCSSEADVASAGTDACDLGESFANTVTGTARYDGSVVIPVIIRRHITTPALGPIDCASGPERCLLAIGAAGDYDRSGGTYFQMADAPRFPEATSTIDPPGPYSAGQEVTIQGASLVPGRQYQVEQCVGDDHCATLSMGRSSAEGTYGATVTIGSAVEVDGDVRECGDDCTLAVRGVGLPEQTTANPPTPIPLGPISGDTAVASAPATTAPPDPGSAAAPTTTVEGTSPPYVEIPPGTDVPATTTEVPTPPTTGPPGTGETTTTLG